MKKIIIYLITLMTWIPAPSQDSVSRFTIPVGSWDLKLVSFNHFYPTYLADPLGIRFEVSFQTITYSDIDPTDRINQGGGYMGRRVIYPGARLSLLKFSPKSNPKLGVSLDFGLTTPVLMRKRSNDLLGLDGIYYFAIAGKPAEWLSIRFTKHHICTHVGDEFTYAGVYSPIDFDPNLTALPVRDDFIVSAAIQPLWFLHDPLWNILQLYGEFGFFCPGKDFLGFRSNKPHREAYLSYQYGAEIEYYFKNKIFGGLYTALNVSAYQMNTFAPNVSFSGGYLLPQERGQRRFRIGFNYYNGRSLSNQFYNRKEKLVAFTVGFDI